jgi:hypothetical protein
MSNWIVDVLGTKFFWMCVCDLVPCLLLCCSSAGSHNRSDITRAPLAPRYAFFSKASKRAAICIDLKFLYACAVHVNLLLAAA